VERQAADDGHIDAVNVQGPRGSDQCSVWFEVVATKAASAKQGQNDGSAPVPATTSEVKSPIPRLSLKSSHCFHGNTNWC
jgi:hypothetical protein